MANFKTWLSAQNKRNDSIGKLAEAAIADKEFPKVSDLSKITDYLTGKGANDILLDNVRQAFAEFESGKSTTNKNLEVSEPGEPKKRGRKPGSKNRVTVNLSENKRGRKPKFVPETTSVPETADQAKAPETVEVKKRGRPRKTENAGATELREQFEVTNSGRQSKSAPVKVPTRLSETQKLLQDAALLIDAQFGRGFASQNPDKVFEFVRIMKDSEQKKELAYLIKSLARELAAVVIKFTKK